MPKKLEKRSIASQLKEEADLEKEGKKRDHLRKQRLLDAVNEVSVWIIYISPFVGAVFLVILLWNDIKTGQFSLMQNILSAMIGYIIAYLQRNGIGGAD